MGKWTKSLHTHSFTQSLTQPFTQPFTPPITTRPPKPGPEPDPGACVAPSIPISYTTHLGCVSIAKCNVGAVLLLPIPKTPWSTGHGPFRAVAPRSRAPLLRRASLPMPLGLYCFRVYERILCTPHTHTHIRYSIPGPEAQGVVSQSSS